MFIIFGTRGVTYSSGSGTFYCPSCARSNPYQHKRVRRFFTLFFIPIIPLNLLGEYIECQSCRGTFKLQVLNYDPQVSSQRFEAEFHRAIRRVMIHMMIADGEIQENEIDMIRGIYSRVAKSEVSRDDLMSEADNVKREALGFHSDLRQLSGSLNSIGKELVVKAALSVAAADGQFQDEERKLIVDIATRLGMTPAHIKGTLQSMLSS